MTTLLIATRNRHKTAEIQSLLGPRRLCLTLNDFPSAPPVVEDAPTFAGNAAKKAFEIAVWLAQNWTLELDPGAFYVLADDSGLEVDALNGAPGVFSARFAALDIGHPGNSADADNNAKLLRLLADIPTERRTARFRCALALAHPADHKLKPENIRIFEGACEGRIQSAPAGESGFGYDPLFVPTGHTQSFAELGAEIKGLISHRSHALNSLKAWLDKAGSQI
jgi:XTP/dITP diphosphohydrolase